jgi:hypothetical protein
MKTKTAYCKLLLQIVPLLLLLLLLPAGCELEQAEYGKIETSSFPKTEEEAKTLLNYMYYYFSGHWFGIFNATIMSDAVTDQFECTWGAETWAGYLYNYYEANATGFHSGNSLKSGNSTSTGGQSLYEYNSILSTLILDVDRMERAEFDETRKNRYIGELKCGMGWLAFMLYDCYGPVPLPTLEILKDPLRGGGTILERASEEEMQAFIETSLKEAAEALPYSVFSPHENRYSDDDYGRFTKGLANFALMKFYMLMGRWADAEDMGRELTKPEYGYQLMGNYNDIFTLANEKNRESIFSGWSISNDGHEWIVRTLPPDYPVDGLNVIGWGGYHMAWPFYETFEQGDARTQRIIAEYTDVDGVFHSKATDREGGNVGRLFRGPAPVKYDWKDGGAVAGITAIDNPVYRYADVLTLLSEAIVRNGGAVTQEAINLLNEVRTRSLGLDKAYSLVDFPNVDVFMEKMLLERGHEFYMEGIRRQDLIRHGKFIEFAIAKNRYAGQPTRHLETAAGAQKYLRFAIPLKHIIDSKGYIQQNPGF